MGRQGPARDVAAVGADAQRGPQAAHQRGPVAEGPPVALQVAEGGVQAGRDVHPGVPWPMADMPTMRKYIHVDMFHF